MYVTFVNKKEDWKQKGTSKGITEVNNIPFIPSFVGAVIFIGAVLIGWLFSKDCATISSLKRSSPFLLNARGSTDKVIVKDIVKT